MELIDLRCLKDFKSKFLACLILDFNKTAHIQQVVDMFGTMYNCEWLFSKMKHAKSTLHSQLSNHHSTNLLLL